MQRYYGINVGDVWRGELPLRRLRVLLEALPTDSRTALAVAGVDDALSVWSLSNVLVGRVVDELSALRWQWESAHLGKNQRPRAQPDSVLPHDDIRRVRSAGHGDVADVIPIVSPHRLGGFINENDERG